MATTIPNVNIIQSGTKCKICGRSLAEHSAPMEYCPTTINGEFEWAKTVFTPELPTVAHTEATLDRHVLRVDHALTDAIKHFDDMRKSGKISEEAFEDCLYPIVVQYLEACADIAEAKKE